MADSKDSYSVSEFNNVFKDKYPFSLFNMNICSLNKHHDELQLLLTEIRCKFDVINLCEIRNINLNSFLNLFDEYEFIYSAPTNKVTGGVGMYVKKSINYKIRNDLFIKNPHIDMICIEIESLNNNKIILLNVYRHHSISIKHFDEIFSQFLHTIKEHKTSIVIVGDFNINLMDRNSKDICDYHKNISFNNFTQLIESPTRETLTTSTLIDHVYYNNYSKYSHCSGTIMTDVSDHFSTFFIMKGKNIPKISNRPLHRVFSQKNIDNFNFGLKGVINDKLKFLYDCHLTSNNC